MYRLLPASVVSTNTRNGRKFSHEPGKDCRSKRYMEDFLHVSGDPSLWAECQSPHLTQLSDGSEGYAVFRVEN